MAASLQCSKTWFRFWISTWNVVELSKPTLVFVTWRPLVQKAKQGEEEQVYKPNTLHNIVHNMCGLVSLNPQWSSALCTTCVDWYFIISNKAVPHWRVVQGVVFLSFLGRYVCCGFLSAAFGFWPLEMQIFWAQHLLWAEKRLKNTVYIGNKIGYIVFL